MVLLYFLLLLVGFVILVKGADFFVEASSNLAYIFGVSTLIVGLTIVSLGTSAPELAVSVSAAIKGSNEIAISNVIGSNIFNLLCVLGACALFFPVPEDKEITRRDLPTSIILTGILAVFLITQIIMHASHLDFAFDKNVANLGRIIGIIFVAIFALYISVVIKNSKQNEDKKQEEAVLRKDKYAIFKCIATIIVSVGMIAFGGWLVVLEAKNIARLFGMSETLIGLTIVAVGTSLPELVTSMVAAKKKETSLAIGNVVGSNIFNLLLILGLSTTINPINVNGAAFVDLIILFLITSLIYFIIKKKHKLTKVHGIFFILIYIADVVFAVVR